MESGAALVVARWIFFSSAMAVFGVALFPLYALRSSRDGEGVIGCQPLIFGAAVLALASSLAWLVLITVDFGGEDPASFVNTASTILFETDFGPAWLVRLAAVFALVASTALRLPEAVVLAPAAIVLGSEAWAYPAHHTSCTCSLSRCLVRRIGCARWRGPPRHAKAIIAGTPPPYPCQLFRLGDNQR